MGDREENMEDALVNTPYDDVFRTLLNDCSSLVIPVINEVFQEHYEGNETIVFYPNEHYINQQDGKEQKRTTDTCFVVYGETQKKYHLECQSNSDSSMLVRIFEYDTQIALDDGRIQGNTLQVTFPHSAVLFLRSNEKTPDNMKIKIGTPEGSISYEIPVMKTQEYTVEQIFEKKLLFLIPFYIFTHESNFSEYDKNETKLETLKNEYEHIRNRLETLSEDKVIDEYTKCTIVDMSNKVLEHIARKYQAVRKGVKAVMGGQVLDYEAKRILNKGKEEGREEGRKEANIATAKKMLLGNMKISVIVEMTDLPKDKVEGLKQEMIKNGQLKEVKSDKARSKGKTF